MIHMRKLSATVQYPAFGHELSKLGHKGQLDERWVDWLDSLAPWTHTATFTCKRTSIRNLPITEDILVDTARHFIRRVNLRCYGKRAKRTQLLPVVATFGWGCYGDQPHLHFCFAIPQGLLFESFPALLEKEANRTMWIDRQRCIKLYQDLGWMNYLVEHGTSNLIVPLINPSSSSNLK